MMHHNPHSFASLLLLKLVKEKNRVTYDSWDHGGVFKVHTQRDAMLEFKPSERGLHYLDTIDKSSNFKYILVNTVRDNFEGYTKHNISKAKEARGLQGMVGKLIEREFAGMVHEKLPTNRPITVQGVDNANRISGPDLANLWGLALRAKPECV